MNDSQSQFVSQSKRKMGSTDKSDTFQRLLLYIAMLTALAAMLGSVAYFLSTSRVQEAGRPRLTSSYYTERVEGELNAQRTAIKELKASLDTIMELPEGSEIAVQIAAIRGNLSNIDTRLTNLEAAIIENPSKALSIPLLRQELSNMRSNYQRDMETSAKQIDRVYDQNKWFIGLMFTMAIGLVGLAVSNFLQTRKASNENSPTLPESG